MWSEFVEGFITSFSAFPAVSPAVVGRYAAALLIASVIAMIVVPCMIGMVYSLEWCHQRFRRKVKDK